MGSVIWILLRHWTQSSTISTSYKSTAFLSLYARCRQSANHQHPIQDIKIKSSQGCLSEEMRWLLLGVSLRGRRWLWLHRPVSLSFWVWDGYSGRERGRRILAWWEDGSFGLPQVEWWAPGLVDWTITFRL